MSGPHPSRRPLTRPPQDEEKRFGLNSRVISTRKIFAETYPHPPKRNDNARVLIHEGRFSRRLGMRIGNGGRSGFRKFATAAEACCARRLDQAPQGLRVWSVRIPNTAHPVWVPPAADKRASPQRKAW